MGVGCYGFVYLAIDVSSHISPIIIGAQLSVPFGLILSKFFLGELISFKNLLLIILSFVGIVIVSYDPSFGEEIIELIFVIFMAFFYSVANILSRFLKNIDTSDQIGWHSLAWCIVLFITSFLFEENPFQQLHPLNINGLFIAIHAGIFISLIGHGGLFYLYRFYPIAAHLPFYSLFPIFGIVLTFLIFFEIPGLYEIIEGIIVIGSVYLIHVEDKKIKVLK